jgi:hypothetical protein
MPLLLLVVAGCPPNKPTPPPDNCKNVFIGDPSQPIEAVLAVSDGVAPTTTDVKDGDAVPLVQPPQGGEVTYATARVRNLNSCHVTFNGRFSDPVTNAEIGFDGRSINLVVGSDGWGRADIAQNASFSNIPACPDYSAQDVQGRSLILEMYVRDSTGRNTVVSHRVVPTCMQADATDRALCVCACSAGFVPGRCGADGGSDGG